MAESFYTILTNYGLAAIANAQVTQSKVDFAKVAVGDSNGAYYTPNSNATSLLNEVWRGPISSISIDENNPNWVIIEAVIPSSAGGFSVREIGVYDTTGNLLAIGKVPETYKPAAAEGSLKDLYLRMILEVSNASVVNLKVDPAVIFASKKYVDDSVGGVSGNITQINQNITLLQESFTEHLADTIRHFDYAVASGTNSYTVTIPGIDELVEGMSVKIKFTNANTGPSTLNINGLGAKSIRKGNGNTLSSGNIKAGQILHLAYTGSNFQILGEGGEYGTATAADVVKGKTIGTENGIVQGALDLAKYKKWAMGSLNEYGYQTISGLGFRPNFVGVFYEGNSTSSAYNRTAFSSRENVFGDLVEPDLYRGENFRKSSNTANYVIRNWFEDGFEIDANHGVAGGNTHWIAFE